jgi:hypothetical protein
MAEIFGNLGRLPSTFEENVGGRVLGSPSHVHVVYIRMALTLLIWLMATAGAFLAWRRRRLDARLVVLGVAPFLSLLLQSYDGEALIRAFLLGLPASVAAAAILLGPSQRGQHAVRGSAFASKVMPVVLTCVLLVLVPVSLVAKYGGESYESVTRGELRAAAWIQARLRPGDLVTTIAPEDAVRSDHAADVDFVTALDQFEAGRLRFVTGLMSKHSGQRFLVLTPSQQAYGTYVAGLEPGWYKDLLRNLARSPDFRPVHQDGRTYVFELRAGVHG